MLLFIETSSRQFDIKGAEAKNFGLTPKCFYSNLYLHFLRPCCENIFKSVCLVSEKIGK